MRGEIIGDEMVVVDNGAYNEKPCGQINLTTGSYDIKIEGFHAAGDVKEVVTYR